jgi:hypothetical protein
MASRLEDRKAGRQEGWRLEGLTGWKDGVKGWKFRSLEFWKVGRLEGWKVGRLEGFLNRLAGLQAGRLQASRLPGRLPGRLAGKRTSCHLSGFRIFF